MMGEGGERIKKAPSCADQDGSLMDILMNEVLSLETRHVQCNRKTEKWTYIDLVNSPLEYILRRFFQPHNSLLSDQR